MVVRRMGTWMERVDERIMEFLADEGWATARTMIGSGGFDASESRLAERCRVLAHAELVAPYVDGPGADVWELTGRGTAYLGGDVDAGSIDPRPRPRPPGAVRVEPWGNGRRESTRGATPPADR